MFHLLWARKKVSVELNNSKSLRKKGVATKKKEEEEEEKGVVSSDVKMQKFGVGPHPRGQQKKAGHNFTHSFPRVAKKGSDGFFSFFARWEKKELKGHQKD